MAGVLLSQQTEVTFLLGEAHIPAVAIHFHDMVMGKLAEDGPLVEQMLHLLDAGCRYCLDYQPHISLLHQ